MFWCNFGRTFQAVLKRGRSSSDTAAWMGSNVLLKSTSWVHCSASVSIHDLVAG